MQFLSDLWRWPSKPVAYRGLLLTDLKKFVEGFLLQLGPGSVFLLERETKPGFLQFAIAERRDRWLKVEYGLPDDEWSRRQFDLVQATMANAGYDTNVETDDENKQIPRFLRVYFEGNRDDLTLTLLQVLEVAANKLEFGIEDRYTLQMLGEIHSDYTKELATQLEQLPQGGWFGRTMAKYLRRLAGRSDQSSKK
jgi:hypothetical protein